MRKRKLKRDVALVNADRAARRERGMGGIPDAEDPDDQLHQIIKLECDLVKLPKKVVLTRWLGCIACIRVMITGREAYVNYFLEESKPIAKDPNRIRPKLLLSTLKDNALFAWFYFLEDTLPILTRMHERSFPSHFATPLLAL